ncbi:unnamed protein product [Brachionus calyciflorus]|uniref:Uncharacterized protein n=1 Tax=Brachionus calyciflorus TaxID=104777 RepID=A0A813M7N9_9BILA|nr:unnamed protein product [Brachionus calyciflorus]
MVGPHNAKNIKKMVELIVTAMILIDQKSKVLYATKEAPFCDFSNNLIQMKILATTLILKDESDYDEEKVDNDLRVIIKDMNSISIPIACHSENEIEEFENVEVENVPENEYLIENDRGLFEDLVIELDDEKGNKISFIMV